MCLCHTVAATVSPPNKAIPAIRNRLVADPAGIVPAAATATALRISASKAGNHGAKAAVDDIQPTLSRCKLG